jgi:hypothetical protein
MEGRRRGDGGATQQLHQSASRILEVAPAETWQDADHTRRQQRRAPGSEGGREGREGGGEEVERVAAVERVTAVASQSVVVVSMRATRSVLCWLRLIDGGSSTNAKWRQWSCGIGRRVPESQWRASRDADSTRAKHQRERQQTEDNNRQQEEKTARRKRRGLQNPRAGTMHSGRGGGEEGTEERW